MAKSLEDLQRQCHRVMIAYWRVAQRKFPSLVGVPMPELKFNLRGRAVGRATYRAGNRLHQTTIALKNEYLLSNTVEMFNDTIPHEVSHIIAGVLFRSTGHDGPWRQVMAAFGLKAQRFTYTNFIPDEVKLRVAMKGQKHD